MNGIELVFYKDIQDEKLVLEESSEILAENAYLKGTSAAAQTNMMCLADDSGVFIKSLDFFPGVHSRRWTGKEEDDKIRNMKIVGYMQDEEDRSALLISRFSLVSADGKELYKTVVKNDFEIADRLVGNKGFGYDSILIPDVSRVLLALKAKKISATRACEIIDERLTIAELTQEEKNAINYRGRIAKEIRKYFDEVHK